MNPSTVQIEARYNHCGDSLTFLKLSMVMGMTKVSVSSSQRKVRFVAGFKDLSEQAAMEVVLEAQQGIDPESNQQGAAQGDQNRKFKVTAEGLRALRGLEDGHGQANRNRRGKEEEGQRRRVPEGMQLARHDQIEGSERTLVQGGEQDAQPRSAPGRSS